MKKSDFDGLMKSMAEAKAYAGRKPARGTRVHVPEVVDVAAIRDAAGLTQMEFSSQIGVSVATLRNWEQKRRSPDGPARVLLAILAKDPGIVRRMFKSAA